MVTPGAILNPLNVLQQRHTNFRGIIDDNDDGIRDDLTMLSNTPATEGLIDRSVVRHGDVMTVEATGRFFNGESLDTSGSEFSVSDLATRSTNPFCFGTTDIYLQNLCLRYFGRWSIRRFYIGQYVLPL